MQITALALSQKIQGQLIGDGANVVTGAAGLKEATATDVTFLKSIDQQNSADFLGTKAGVLIVPANVTATGKTIIQVSNPLAAFAAVLALIDAEKKTFVPGSHSTAYVSAKAIVHASAFIGPFSVVEDGACIGENTALTAHVYIGKNSKVGADCLLYPNVVLREEVTVGNRCILHAGCVVGSDGYGFYFDGKRHQKIAQVGTVHIEDDVEIGSCTTIDRATTGQTVIKKGTKIDNLVQVAHNVEIGENCLLVAQSGIAGSCKLGKGVVIAGQVGVGDHVIVADGTQVGGQSGVRENSLPGQILWGTPALPIKETMKQTALLKRLPELFKDVKSLKDKIFKS